MDTSKDILSVDGHIETIFQLLSITELAYMSRTCKRFNTFVKSVINRRLEISTVFWSVSKTSTRQDAYLFHQLLEDHSLLPFDTKIEDLTIGEYARDNLCIAISLHEFYIFFDIATYTKSGNLMIAEKLTKHRLLKIIESVKDDRYPFLFNLRICEKRICDDYSCKFCASMIPRSNLIRSYQLIKEKSENKVLNTEQKPLKIENSPIYWILIAMLPILVSLLYFL